LQPDSRRLANLAFLTFLYVVSGKLPLYSAFLHPGATQVWANSGIALAALLIFGTDVWPYIFLGAFLVNISTPESLATSVAISIGNTLEAVTGAWLVRTFASGKDSVFRGLDFLKFAILAGLVSTSLSATVGVTSLCVGGLANSRDYWPVWSTWWLGHMGGNILVAPVFLLWTSGRGNPWKWARIRLEAVVLLVSIILAGQVVFNGILLPSGQNYPLEYLCMPFLAWAALRFGQRESAVSMLIFSGIAIGGTLDRLGPFGRGSLNESLVLLQAFLGVTATLTMIVSAEVSERRQAEADARALATSDALTGLGNHRRLVDALNAEIQRGSRMSTEFAFLILDLDRLKRINDLYGHLTGNRALCRLANVLRLHCRNYDIAARYGGDEFAIVLPNANRQTAHNVANRIRQELAAEMEHPPISVSVGIAMWPEDGMTLEKLVQTADKDLYRMKNQGGGAFLKRKNLEECEPM
jgi:diguanylate cyclase (GGDEF)-like protein